MPDRKQGMTTRLENAGDLGECRRIVIDMLDDVGGDHQVESRIPGMA